MKLKIERLRWLFEDPAELPSEVFVDETKLAKINIVRRSRATYSRDGRLISMGVYAVLETVAIRKSTCPAPEFYALEFPSDFHGSKKIGKIYDISSFYKSKPGTSYHVALKCGARKMIAFIVD